ncbi:MAG: cyanophycin synthetase, partial [Planctomycetota bacterium]
EEFEGLPHRYQYLGEFHGIRFIDDSKATSPESAMAALNRTGSVTHWLCGGQPKGSDLSSYREITSNQPLHAYCFGEVQDSLCRTLGSAGLKANKFADLESAFAAALKQAQAKDVILLSPGFASFDQFRSFEERGQYFQELCREFQNRGSQAG